MENFSPSDLKAILHSKRANIFYLEHCRVMQKDGRVLYVTETPKENLYFNIPIANTTVILLGTGTSITQAAVRMLTQAGVLIGFTGGGGVPLYMGSEVEWLTPQNEYRPTEYVQGWLSFWFDEEKRLARAKSLQLERIEFFQKVWIKDSDFQHHGFDINNPSLHQQLSDFLDKNCKAKNTTELLSNEAHWTKQLYQYATLATNIDTFTRKHDAKDKANAYLNLGNYLAYGLAACSLWVLGLPHGFALLHGKTRRGALVFDIADLIKDALVLPLAFICAKDTTKEQAFRQQLLQKFTQHKALDFMFDTIKMIALDNSRPDLQLKSRE